MGEGNRRNRPCWCGSGKKYKRCHLSREEARAPTRSETLSAFRRIFGQRQCLHPMAPDDCDGPIIRAHTVSRGAGLSHIAREGHVYYFDPDPGSRGDSGQVVPRLTGIRRASVFNGFCASHDNALFSPLDDEPVTFTDEQLFLLAYRALSREIFLKERAARHLGWLRAQADRGKNRHAQVRMQGLLEAHEQGTEAGHDDLRAHKTTLDRLLLSRRFSEVESAVFEIDTTPSILSSGAWLPEYDFHGRALQDLAAVERAEGVFTSGVVTEAGGAFVLSWLRGHQAPARFASSLASLSDSEVPHALVRFLFQSSENLCMSPSWWDSLEEVTRSALIARFNASLNPAELRSQTCLTDDGVRAVGWRIVRRSGAAAAPGPMPTE